MDLAIAGLAFLAVALAHGGAHWLVARVVGRPAPAEALIPAIGCAACARGERTPGRALVHLAGPLASYLAIAITAAALFAAVPVPTGATREVAGEVVPVREQLGIGPAVARGFAFPIRRTRELFGSLVELVSPSTPSDPGGPVAIDRAFTEAAEPPLVRAFRPVLDACVLLWLALGLYDVVLALAALRKRARPR